MVILGKPIVKPEMKHHYFLFLAGLFAILCNAQTKNTAIGQVKYKVRYFPPGGESFYPANLAFDSVASVQTSFRYGMDTDTGNVLNSEGNAVMMVSSPFDEKGFIYYRNIKTRQVMERQKKNFGNPAFTVTDEWIDIQWELKNSFKKIAGYKSQKAVGKFRGRTWTVWFAKDIPHPFGPYLLHGLPGMILEASTYHFLYVATEVCYPCDPAKTDMIEPPQEERNYTIKEFVYRYDNRAIFGVLELQKRGITDLLCSDIPDEKIIWEDRQYAMARLYEWENKDTKRALTNKDTLDATINYEAIKQQAGMPKPPRRLGMPDKPKPAPLRQKSFPAVNNRNATD